MTLVDSFVLVGIFLCLRELVLLRRKYEDIKTQLMELKERLQKPNDEIREVTKPSRTMWD